MPEVSHNPNGGSIAAPGASQPNDAQPVSLAALRDLRSAPALNAQQRLQLRQELEQAIAPYPWFTLGVMAPSAENAIATLRQVEAALGWSELRPADPAAENTLDPAVSVFLKGNQRTGLYHLRAEAGLGQGLLIAGQEAPEGIACETWGPLPLDLFA